MFYTYRQNNTGGSFVEDRDRGISVMVIVEARGTEEADRKAEEIGLYWNGCDIGADCSCCGDRWTPMNSPWGGGYDDGTEVPTYAGADVFAVREKGVFSTLKWAEPEGFVHYEDGRVEPFNLLYEGDVPDDKTGAAE